jgi:uncharacterized membrane protein
MGCGMLQRSIKEFLKRHWLVVGFLTIVFVWIPEWVSNIWGLYSGEPLFGVMVRRFGEMNMPTFSPYWITIPISVLMFLYLVYLKVSERGSSVTHLATKTTEEAKNERFHNRRTIPLRIEFLNNYEFKHIGKSTGIGLQQRHQQMYRVAIHNTTEKDIEGIQVWLTKIDPMPSELMGHIPLPLHVTHEQENVNTVRLSSKEKRLVDVVSFFDRFWQPNIQIHHTSTVAKQEIYQGDDSYEIELMAKGKDVSSSRRRFKIGVNGQDLFMESLDQPAEEAFREVFESESQNL